MTLVPLPAVLDMSAAIRIAETLRGNTGPIVLDGSEVDRIGIAGLQLLLSAHATAAASGHPFEIERPSPALQAASRIAGAQSLLAFDR